MCEGNVLHSNAETYRLAVKADTFFIVVQVPDDAASFLPFGFSLSPVVSDLNTTVFKCLTCTARSVSNARFTRCVSLKSITCVIVYRTSFTGIVFCIFVHFHV